MCHSRLGRLRRCRGRRRSPSLAARRYKSMSKLERRPAYQTNWAALTRCSVATSRGGGRRTRTWRRYPGRPVLVVGGRDAVVDVGGRRVWRRGAPRPCPSWRGGRLTEPIGPLLPSAPPQRVAGAGRGRGAGDHTLDVPSSSWAAEALSWTSADAESSGEALRGHFQAEEEGGLPGPIALRLPGALPLRVVGAGGGQGLGGDALDVPSSSWAAVYVDDRRVR